MTDVVSLLQLLRELKGIKDQKCATAALQGWTNLEIFSLEESSVTRKKELRFVRSSDSDRGANTACSLLLKN